MPAVGFEHVELKCPCGKVIRKDRVNVNESSTQTVHLRCPSCKKDVKFQIKSGRVSKSFD